MMEVLFVYSLLTSALFYLGSRAKITQVLWSKYPPWLASWADCAACSGAWYGFAVGLVASNSGADLPRILTQWWSPLIVGLCSIVWTPIVAGFMQAGFERLGTTIAEDDAQT
jgi:hypothetical protein